MKLKQFFAQVAKDFTVWLIIGFCGFIASSFSKLTDSVTELNKNMAVLVSQMTVVNEQTKQNTADIRSLERECLQCTYSKNNSRTH